MRKILEGKELDKQDMKEFKREAVKVYGFSRFFKSIKYSINGLVYAYKYEQSLWIHGLATILAITMGIIFKIKFSEWAIIFIALGSILALELINTAIEAAVDLTTTKIHPLAKIAKDCGSAASFVMAIVSIVISLFVFGPYLQELCGLL
ncbi:MAG: diacylglycerol kinase [Ruminococcus sp.]|nr:diacylglycerol kinase [Ruminococcus sp.]